MEEIGPVERRFKVVSGKKRFLCVGKDNTCEHVVTSGTQCGSCLSGKTVTKAGTFANLKEGEITVHDGYRCKRSGKTIRRFCKGMNDTCVNYIVENDMCKGCANGPKKVGRVGLIKGDINEVNGIRYAFDGTKNKPLCGYNCDPPCEKQVQSNDRCQQHMGM